MLYLPKTLEIHGKDYAIRTDYRVALTIFEAFNDKSLLPQLVAPTVLQCLFKEIPEDVGEAYKKAVWFLDGGNMPKSKKAPKRTMDWEQDEYLIFPALNKAAGCELRTIKYLHWWTFLGLFNEIGEGLYSQVMSIRTKRAYGKKLEKWECEFFEKNKELIVICEKLTDREQAEIDRERELIEQFVG